MAKTNTIKSRKDYAELCYMSQSSLANYIKRGKVRENEFKRIDILDPINAAFLAHRKTGFNEEYQNKIKDLELRRKQKDLELLEIKEQKLRSELVPKNLMKNVFSVFAKSCADSFITSSEDIATLFIKKLGGDRGDIVEFRRLIGKAVNEGIETAKINAVDSLDKISGDYSEVRSRGETK